MYACENGADDVAIVLVEAGASYHIPPSVNILARALQLYDN